MTAAAMRLLSARRSWRWSAALLLACALLPGSLLGGNGTAAARAAAAGATPGRIAHWGDDSGGQATPPAGLAGVVAIDGGHAHSLALRADGTVVAWGSDGAGQSTVPSGL